MRSVQRVCIPGSEWLYFKIYTGYKTADNLLGKDILAIINKLNKKQLIEKWFFIRYADPDYHIRIRFLLKDEKYIGDIISLMYKQLNYMVIDNLIWKIQIDTYQRELERYGGELIEESESLFFKDSQCILTIIKYINIYKEEKFRWMIALKMIDSLLSDFNFSLEEKQLLMESLSGSFKREFGFNQYNSKQFNDKFRENKKYIELVLDNKISDKRFIKFYKLIKDKSKEIIPIINQLIQRQKAGKIKISRDSLLSGYIHMTLNRLFISKNRIHELILYDFLRRYYTSMIAKNKYTKT